MGILLHIKTSEWVQMQKEYIKAWWKMILKVHGIRR